jgi:hypothetical protein
MSEAAMRVTMAMADVAAMIARDAVESLGGNDVISVGPAVGEQLSGGELLRRHRHCS